MSARISYDALVLVTVLLCVAGAMVLYYHQGRQTAESQLVESGYEVEAFPVAEIGANQDLSVEESLARSEAVQQADRREEKAEPEEEIRNDAEAATEAWLAAYTCVDGCENELSGLAEEPWSLEDAYWLYRAGHPTAEERAYWTGSDAGLYDAIRAARAGNARAMNALASHYLEQGDPEEALRYGRSAAQRCSPLGARLEAQAYIDIGDAVRYRGALVAMRKAYLLGDTTVIPVLYEAADAIGYEMWMLAGPDETALRAVTLAMQHHTQCRHPGFRPVDLG